MPDASLASPPLPTIHREDYRPPDWLVPQVALNFALGLTETHIEARLTVARNPAGGAGAPLRLNGDGIEPAAVRLDGAVFAGWRREGDDLLLDLPGDAHEVAIETRIDPAANSQLMGLYASNGMLCTQCEAEGFRRITFFPDRPDVLSVYRVRMAGDRAMFPVLLSNGNCVATGDGPDGSHWAEWHDPWPKPSYLFALVAGQLVANSGSFTTMGGREVALNIWVRPGDEGRTGHALASLIAAMKWDEEAFGREYDLDLFNVVAVADFNMGAMENKGLNVFNTRYVLALPETATDTDYQQIAAVIAHEYFHNWTGNRITCRDWFQLSLKEGLTVFRDQQFSADQGSPAVKRLQDVRRLRAAQFTEDAGPLAHPVRPDEYAAIDNFYTPTIYEKGAELVRMLHRRLGVAGFRAGMDRYFARHDNSAVTLEDFVAALQDGSGVDIAEFMAWYGQAGTPELHVEERYDAAARRYVLRLRQHTAPTRGQPEKRPLPIPVATALLGPDGAELVPTTLLMLRETAQDFVFDDVAAEPVPSLLRDFSAPVRLIGLSRAQLLFLAAHDRDPFVRWDSFQNYATEVMLEMIAAGSPFRLDDGLLAALAATLANADADHAFAAEALALPGEAAIAARMATVDVEGIHAARRFLRQAIGAALGDPLRATHDRLTDPAPYRPDGPAIGRRALRNMCLSYLVAAGDTDRAATQFAGAGNMTDALAALAALADTDTPARGAALAAFHDRWHQTPLVLDKWFAIQATSALPGTPATVRALLDHADFDLRNPNRTRALVGSFAAGNQLHFHDATGAGYRLLADVLIRLDPINGQAAARLLDPLGPWRRHEPGRAALMQGALRRILDSPEVSRFTREKAQGALGE